MSLEDDDGYNEWFEVAIPGGINRYLQMPIDRLILEQAEVSAALKSIDPSKDSARYEGVLLKLTQITEAFKLRGN